MNDEAMRGSKPISYTELVKRIAEALKSNAALQANLDFARAQVLPHHIGHQLAGNWVWQSRNLKRHSS